MWSKANSFIITIGVVAIAADDRKRERFLKDGSLIDKRPPIRYPIDRATMKTVMTPPQTYMLLPKYGARILPLNNSMLMT